MNADLAAFQIDLCPGHARDLPIAGTCVQQPHQQVRVVLPGLVCPSALARILCVGVDSREQCCFFLVGQVAQPGLLGVHPRESNCRCPFLSLRELHDSIPVGDRYGQRVVGRPSITPLLDDALHLRKGQVAHTDVRQCEEVLEVHLRVGVPSGPLPCVKESLDNRVQQDGLGTLEDDFLDRFRFPKGCDLLG
jgi:hypothetical protein